MEYLGSGSSKTSVLMPIGTSRHASVEIEAEESLENFAFRTPQEASAELPYDRSLLEPSIVHFGPSNFFRSHFATIIEDTNLDIASRGGVPSDGAAVVSMVSPGGIESLRNQDYLYTTGEIAGNDQRSMKLVGSVVYGVFSPDYPDKTADLLKGADLISLTVTFKGYHVHAPNGQLVSNGDGDVAHDAVVLKSRLQGRSFSEIGDGFGYRTPMGAIVEELLRRDKEGSALPVLMSLDNTPPFSNERVLREALRGIVEEFGAISSGQEDLQSYRRAGDSVERLVILSTVVDRITPQQHQVDRDWLRQDHNIEDALAVISEGHRSLKYQAIDPKGLMRSGDVRLPDFIQSSHVTRVDDVQAALELKSRCLNSLDVVAGQVGTRIGAKSVWDFVSNPVMASLEDVVLANELSRGVQAVPQLDVMGFCEEVRERRHNKEISSINELSRLNNKGSEKMPARIGAALSALIDSPEEANVLTITYACYLRNIIDGVNEKGESVKLQDDNPAAIQAIRDSYYKGAEKALVAMVGEESEFYKHVRSYPTFSEGFASAVDVLRADEKQNIADLLVEVAARGGIQTVLLEQKWLFGCGEGASVLNTDDTGFPERLEEFYFQLGRRSVSNIVKEIVNPVNKEDN